MFTAAYKNVDVVCHTDTVDDVSVNVGGFISDGVTPKDGGAAAAGAADADAEAVAAREADGTALQA